MNKGNHIAQIEEKQEPVLKLSRQIVENLPADLEESAKEYGVIMRKREIKSALDLIRMLLIYAVIGVSQRLLAAFACVLDVANISDQAWQNKALKCQEWLIHILSETLPGTKAIANDTSSLANRQINLVDCTYAKQCGAKGKPLRIHMCYSLTHACMNEVLVTDLHTAESITLFDLTPKSINLADAGFGTGKNYAYVVSRQADALFRVTPSHLLLTYDPRRKEKIDMLTMLDTRKDIIEFTCLVHTENRKYLPTRIIASRLPEDKLETAIKRTKRKAQKNQYKLQDKTLFYAQWVVLMTSLDESYSADDILKLYRSRWQIELLFKRIKQFFKVTKIKKATMKHSKVLVLLWLIAWSLIERETLRMEKFLISKQADMSRFSLWSVSEFFFQCFKAMIFNCWICCVDIQSVLDDIYERLRNHKARRRNQYFLSRFHLLPVVFS